MKDFRGAVASLREPLLLRHFEQIAEAPDAVPCLRRFILDLAVRGKLVEQDPNDEPASELLQRIEAAKDRLIIEGEFKKKENSNAVADDELGFIFPDSWCVARMGWIARKLGAGSTPLGGRSIYQSEGIPFIRSQNVYNDGLRLDDVALIPRKIHGKMAGTNIQNQDILLNITGASIGRSALVPNDFIEGNVSQHVAIIRLIEPEIREFIHLLLISPFYQNLILRVQVGVSREGLSMQRLSLFPMLLPPLAEQHRIVAKVDELMVLCNELEAAQAKREKRRNRLVAATLAKLTVDNAEYAEKGIASSPSLPSTSSATSPVPFFLAQLPRLTTRSEHIQQLRQTILNLAVRGKLVPQQSESINQKICELETQEVNFQKASSEVIKSGWPFREPNSWKWDRLDALTILVTDGEHATPLRINEEQVPLVTAKNVRDGYMDYAETDWVSYQTALKAWQRCQPKIGDILMVCVGATTGRLCILQEEKEMVLVRSVALIRPGSMVSVDFLALALRSPICQKQIWDKVKITAQPCLYINRINSLAIPLPPLAEQYQIVTKVDELMVLCDELDTSLNLTFARRRQLLEAVLNEEIHRGVMVAG